MSRLRRARERVLAALKDEPFDPELAVLADIPAKTLTGPLLACLLEPDPLTRWRAVTAFGAVLARLAADRLEDARMFMRQLMWRLNEESGNIAWGVPEAFGEILARQPALAAEFHRVLASYIHERDCPTGDNYLELDSLRRGVHWALARLAEVRPELVRPAVTDLLKALTDGDPQCRGLAARALGLVLPLLTSAQADVVRGRLAPLTGDDASLDFYGGGALRATTVAALVRQALGG